MDGSGAAARAQGPGPWAIAASILQGLYGLQVLDSYDNPTYASMAEAGAIYKEAAPLVNGSKPAPNWQTL